MIGHTLSHYDITTELGRGGMGIVYRATDTKLNRDVALKILPAAALASEEDRARFFREAQAAAQLHHPNIATVFEIDEAILRDGDGNEVNATDGPRPYIAMEFVGGETLQETIAKAPLKLADAVNITSQVAEALKAAHAKEIVHRDIKSANVMISEDGIAKVLDFGLAKTNNSTMLTRMGSTLGTVAYMSPEQARGQEVDGRSDLYSLGTMMYEMICGALPFSGEYEQAVVYGILNESPDPLTSKRTGVPMQLEWIVNKLLAKEADYRYQSAAGLLADLMTVDLSGSGQSRRSMPAMSNASIPAAPSGSASSSTPKWVWPAVAAGLFFGLTVAWFLKPSGTERITKMAAISAIIDMGDIQIRNVPTLSEDGRFLAFNGVTPTNSQPGIFLWDLSTEQMRRINDAAFFSKSTFSHDSRWMVFSTMDGLFKVPTSAGTPVQISDEDGFWPIFFDDTRILLERRPGNRVDMVSLEGDGERLVFTPDSLQGHTRIVPIQPVGDGEHVVLMVYGDETRYAAIGSIEDGTYETFLRDAAYGRYVDSGHFVFIQGGEGEGVLMARPFNLKTLDFLGPAAPVQERHVQWNAFDVTSSGILVDLGREILSDADVLKWYDTSGEFLGDLPADEAQYGDLHISPDGRQVAVNVGSLQSGEEDVYILDAESGIPDRLSFSNDGNRPFWHPDGEIVFYDGPFDGSDDILLFKNADGTGVESRLFDTNIIGGRVSISQDGSTVAYYARESNEAGMVVRSLADSLEMRIITRPTNQFDGAISPNGLYVAFSTFEQGSMELYVQEVDSDAFWVMSVPEDQAPQRAEWSRDGRWLYYRSLSELKRVAVRYEPSFARVGRPQVVLKGLPAGFHFSLHPDGERILVAASADGGFDSADSRIHIKLNLGNHLRDVAPVDE